MDQVGTNFTSEDFVYLAFDQIISSKQNFSLNNVEEIEDSNGNQVWKIGFDKIFAYNDEKTAFSINFLDFQPLTRINSNNLTISRPLSIRYAKACPSCVALDDVIIVDKCDKKYLNDLTTETGE